MFQANALLQLLNEVWQGRRQPKQTLCTPAHLILHLQSTLYLHFNKALKSQLQKLLCLYDFLICSIYRVSTCLEALAAKSSHTSKLKKTSRFSNGAKRR